MIATAAPFIISVLITASLCVITKRPFGKNIVTGLYSMSVILYLSQYLLGSFTPGLYLLYLAAAASVPLILAANGGISANRKYLLTGGLWAYIGCLAVIAVMDAGRLFISWDEFMHWGKMVKEMIRLDRFYCVTESTLYRHKDYPPFIALLEYAWCRIGGKYSEPHVAQALHLLNVSLIVPYLFEQFSAGEGRSQGEGRSDAKDSISGAVPSVRAAAEYFAKGIMAAVAVLILCSLCDPNTNINSIYEDITIGLMFAYSAFLVYQKEYRTHAGRFAYLMSLVALIGTKQIGLAFIGLSLLYLALSILFLEDTAKAKRQGLVCAALSAAAAAAYYLSWDRMVSRYPGSRQFDLGSNISLRLFLQRIADSSDRVHRDMLKRFIFAMFEKNIASGPIMITYFTSFFIAILILAALALLLRDRISRRETAILGIVFTVGEGGYALMMLMLYELCFERQEMNSMHSFPRYMGSYFLAELALLFMIAVWLRGRQNLICQNIGRTCIAFMLAIVLVVPGKLGFLVPQGLYGDRVYDTRQRGKFITDHIEEGSTVYLLYERSDGDLEQVRYSYFVDGSYIDHNYFDFTEKNPDVSSLEEILGNDKYVYSLKVTKGMNTILSAYNGGEKLKDYTLYEVQENGGKITLREIAESVTESGK